MEWKSILLALMAILASVCAPVVNAEPVSDFRQAITQAVLSSPRVNASWYNFEATREAQRSARAAYLPSVDINGDIGEEERETPLVDIGSYSRDATRFSITQMLFDGFQTREEVSRLGHEKLSLYYELKRASEETALEAADAYLDTMRYEKLVELAENNYVVHRQIFDKIAERSRGGVSQGVDLEQAAGRVALAESNLLTEMTNLHDVRTRFQRIVGELPAEDLVNPIIPATMIPQQRQRALNRAYELSPEISAAIENMRAAQAAKKATNAPFMPRIDLRYRNERENDTDGIDGRFDTEAIELVFTYNLFRGGADSARKREYYNRFNAAIEERKQACLNVRQNVMIAFNDIAALEQQLVYLNQSMLSQDKTRRAYRDQFNLGRRSLLDLLDSQNEYFDTQRSYYSAKADLLSARATTLSYMGLLLAALEVDGLNETKISGLKLDLDRGNDAKGQPLCPPEAPNEIVIDNESMITRLMEKNSLNLVRNHAGDVTYWTAAPDTTGRGGDIIAADIFDGGSASETTNSHADININGFGGYRTDGFAGDPGKRRDVGDDTGDSFATSERGGFGENATSRPGDSAGEGSPGSNADITTESVVEDNTGKTAENNTGTTAESAPEVEAETAAASVPDSNADVTTGSFADRYLANPRESSVGRSATGSSSTVEVPIRFAFNSYYIPVAVQLGPEVANLAEALSKNPDSKVIVEGHTDTSGNDPGWNLLLSTRRANAVRDRLIKDYGVNPDQITAVGYGSKRPVAGNDTREGRKRNRRVVLVMDTPAPASAWAGTTP